MLSVAAADVEAIERATLDAVAPQAIHEIDGWLLPFDSGSIGRAKSAVPLRHRLEVSTFEPIRAEYAARARPLAEFDPAPDPAWAALFLGQGRQTLAAGAGAYSRGWASAHGMRTAHVSASRGRQRSSAGAVPPRRFLDRLAL